MTRNQADLEVHRELRDLTALMTQCQSAVDQMLSHETVLSRIPEPAACIDRRYIYKAVNKAYLSWYQKAAEEVLGHTVAEVIGEELFQEREKTRLDRALAGEEAQYEDLFSYPGAQLRHVLLRYYPLEGKGGSIGGVVFSARDITGRKDFQEKVVTARRNLEAQAGEYMERLSQTLRNLENEVERLARTEDELRKDREMLSKIFQTIPDAVSLSTYDEGVFWEVNDAFLRMSGYSREEVIGNTSLNLGIWFDHSERSVVMDMIRNQGRVRNLEVKFRVKGGEPRIMLVSAEPLNIESKSCVLFDSRDITELKNLESEMIRSQKMEAMGRLAGGITHDFNNLLTAIDGYCELALLKLGRPEQVRTNILKIKEVKNTASSLIRQLLAFSRRQVVKPQTLDINTVIENMKNLLKQFIGEDIELKTSLQEGIGNVYADQGQVEQIIMNLALNARDAMKKGGTLTISTQRAHLNGSAAEMHLGLVPGDYLKLEVSDTGEGMDEETMAHAFEPFFTTKETSKGTGLGLATVYGIIRNAGGAVSLRSEVGKGTTFEILLPVSGESPEAVSTKPDRVPVRGGSETILVVEDNPYVLDLITEVLGSIGYTLLKARNGKETMDIFTAHSGEIDLVIADVVLPGMDGPTIVKGLMQKYPRIKILYITGYPGEVVSLYGIPDTERHLLQKPFSASALTEKVREVLDEDSEHRE